MLCLTNTGEPYAAPVNISGLLVRDRLVSQKSSISSLPIARPTSPSEKGVTLFQDGQIAPWQRGLPVRSAETSIVTGARMFGRILKGKTRRLFDRAADELPLGAQSH